MNKDNNSLKMEQSPIEYTADRTAMLHPQIEMAADF